MFYPNFRFQTKAPRRAHSAPIGELGAECAVGGGLCGA